MTQPFETYLNKAPFAFMRWENRPGWPVIYASTPIQALLGYAPERFCNGDLSYAELVHPDDRDRVDKEVAHALDNGSSEFEHRPYRLQNKQGDWIWVKDTTEIIRDEQGQAVEFYGFLQDWTDLISYKKQAQKAQLINRQINQALDESNLVSRSDAAGRITYVNDHLLALTGYTRKELIGQPHSILRHPDTPRATFQDMWQTIQNGQTWKGTLKNRKKSGDAYWVEMTLLPLFDENGQFAEYLAIRHEVTELVRKQMALNNALTTSRLLNIPNRLALIEAIEEADKPVLAMLDLDNFRQINEYFGHSFGDQLLIHFMLHVFYYKPLEYRLFHLGSDQLVLLAENVHATEFSHNLQQLRENLNEKRYCIRNQEIMTNPTLALSFEPKDNLLRSLEIAMRYAKRHHHNQITYASEIDQPEQRAQNLKWSAKLNQALQDDRITVHFQPIYNYQSQRIERHECLVRLIDTDQTVVSPFYFLDVSKRTKKYYQLSRRVASKAFEQFEACGLPFSINISSLDMTRPSYAKHLLHLLDSCSAPENVTLEILESEDITDFAAVHRFIEKVRQRGCQIAIDDFGAGYANYHHLLSLDADYIKIDGSLIKGLADNQDAYDIVESIVSFARKRGIATIAEFVSDQRIFDCVRELNIDFAQGFYIGAPQAEPQREFTP
ncbi:EAL domain-containing protein [Hydrogenovibrio halophilus]|uniref:EAL domain-containing protein n=1 Tax=Hydrogenovibrio halophilus TaxID=373391 RepID=UPI00146BDE84|nr:EAL domain-containing protein [Hydrogenovibrio halophilus]